MTNSMSRPRAAALLALLCTVQLSPATAQGSSAAPSIEEAASPTTVDELMARLQKMPGLYARFEERKTIALLAAPLVNHGHVRFHPPTRLRRTIDRPTHSSVLLLDDEIWLEERGEAEHIDLKSHPAARSFVGSFRALLAGDRAALDAHFVLTLDVDDGGAWTLRLLPRTEGMKKLVHEMSIEGKGDQLHVLHIEEASGDVSDTRFFDVDVEREHSPQDVTRYFSAPSR